jgi:hypothetical protein
MSVGEDLKINITVRFEDLKQIFVHERLATENSKKAVAHRFGLSNRAVSRIYLNSMLLSAHINPASLATQVTAIDYRQVKKWGKELATF